MTESLRASSTSCQRPEGWQTEACSESFSFGSCEKFGGHDITYIFDQLFYPVFRVGHKTQLVSRLSQVQLGSKYLAQRVKGYELVLGYPPAQEENIASTQNADHISLSKDAPTFHMARATLRNALTEAVDPKETLPWKILAAPVLGSYTAKYKRQGHKLRETGWGSGLYASDRSQHFATRPSLDSIEPDRTQHAIMEAM